MPERENDSILIEKVVKGDPTAFDQIFEKYHRKVYLFSLRNFRNKEDAEGAVQDVFYNLWKDREQLKRLNDLEAWIFSICLNIIRKHFRRLAIEKKHLKEIVDNYLDSDNSTGTEVEYRDLLDKTENIINKLPPRQKTIFLLSRKKLMSNLEISEKLKISKRTVDNQLTKSKAFVRKALFDGSLLPVLFFYLFID